MEWTAERHAKSKARHREQAEHGIDAQEAHEEWGVLLIEIERLKGELTPPDGLAPWGEAEPPSREDMAAAHLREVWLAVRWAPEARQHFPPWSVITESERRAWRAMLEV